jgi:Trk-type K+ transport system membrane component
MHIRVAFPQKLGNLSGLIMSENLFIDFLGIFYLIMTPLFFSIWLNFFQRDSSLSYREKRLSWVILLTATILWPVVVLIAYLELLSKHNINVM